MSGFKEVLGQLRKIDEFGAVLIGVGIGLSVPEFEKIPAKDILLGLGVGFTVAGIVLENRTNKGAIHMLAGAMILLGGFDLGWIAGDGLTPEERLGLARIAGGAGAAMGITGIFSEFVYKRLGPGDKK